MSPVCLKCKPVEGTFTQCVWSFLKFQSHWTFYVHKMWHWIWILCLCLWFLAPADCRISLHMLHKRPFSYPGLVTSCPPSLTGTNLSWGFFLFVFCVLKNVFKKWIKIYNKKIPDNKNTDIYSKYLLWVCPHRASVRITRVTNQTPKSCIHCILINT